MTICLCGCGKEVKERNVYIHGHNRKNKSHTPETKKQMSQKFKNRIVSFETKQKLSKLKTGFKHTEETKKKMSEKRKGRSLSEGWKQKISKSMTGKKLSENCKKKKSIALKYTIEQFQNFHPFFSKIEEMRYNPDKTLEKEIQVHCKNHNCINSKEKGGWFTPTRLQLFNRIDALEKPGSWGESNFYCGDFCKNNCPLYNSKPFISKDNIIYNQEEYDTFRKFVLERDNYICQFCGEKATDVHHEKPQKLEPFFSLDPDYAWSCCEPCHYKKGHKDECNTGNLANSIC